MLCLLVASAVVCSTVAQAEDSADSILAQAFDLGGERSEVAQYYRMESTLLTYAADGRLQSTDVFRLDLEYLTAGLAGGEDAQITCLFFTVQKALPLLSEGASVILNASVVAHSGLVSPEAQTGSWGSVGSGGVSSGP